MATNLFNPEDLTEGEKEFVHNVLADDKPLEVGSLYIQRAQALATLRLAKEIDKSVVSSNRSSLALNLLTGALVLVGIAQIIVAVLNNAR